MIKNKKRKKFNKLIVFNKILNDFLYNKKNFKYKNLATFEYYPYIYYCYISNEIKIGNQFTIKLGIPNHDRRRIIIYKGELILSEEDISKVATRFHKFIQKITWFEKVQFRDFSDIEVKSLTKGVTSRDIRKLFRKELINKGWKMRDYKLTWII